MIPFRKVSMVLLMTTILAAGLLPAGSPVQAQVSCSGYREVNDCPLCTYWVGVSKYWRTRITTWYTHNGMCVSQTQTNTGSCRSC